MKRKFGEEIQTDTSSDVDAQLTTKRQKVVIKFPEKTKRKNSNDNISIATKKLNLSASEADQADPTNELLPLKLLPISPNWQILQEKLGISKKIKKSVNVQPKSNNNDNVDSDNEDEVKNDDYSHTKYLALDCEMVGVGDNGVRSALARCCIVNWHGNIIYDKYVKPQEAVTDFRTFVSGIRPKDLRKAISFREVQKEVSDIIDNKILIGHSINNDLNVLFLSHPKRMIRDTAMYKPLQRRGRSRALKLLAKEILGFEIQSGEHSPAEDARSALLIYKRFKKDWEKSLHKQHIN